MDNLILKLGLILWLKHLNRAQILLPFLISNVNSLTFSEISLVIRPLRRTMVMVGADSVKVQQHQINIACDIFRTVTRFTTGNVESNSTDPLRFSRVSIIIVYTS